MKTVLSSKLMPIGLPWGYRVLCIISENKHKYVVQFKSKILPFIWLSVRKFTLNVYVDESKGAFEYSDQYGRTYEIVKTDGNCSTLDEVYDFITYSPFKIHMTNSKGQQIRELWANNKIAKYLLGATDSGGHSRIGLFYPNASDTHFEPIKKFWERFFAERYGFQNINT